MIINNVSINTAIKTLKMIKIFMQQNNLDLVLHEFQTPCLSFSFRKGIGEYVIITRDIFQQKIENNVR